MTASAALSTAVVRDASSSNDRRETQTDPNVGLCQKDQCGTEKNIKTSDLISHEWEDTEKDVHISLAIGGVVEEDVDLLTSCQSIMVRLKDGRQWACSLHKEVLNEETKCIFGKDKIAIVAIKKEGGVSWPQLGLVSTLSNDKSSMIKLHFVKDTFYDKQDTIHYVVMVNRISNVHVEFASHQFTYYFSSDDAKFLEMNGPATNESVFFRTINTKHEIQPTLSSYRLLKGKKLEIKLRKVQTVRWTAVEAPSSTDGALPVKQGSWQSLSSLVTEDSQGSAVSAPKLPLPAETTSVADVCQIGVEKDSEKVDKSEKEESDEAVQLVPKPTCIVPPLELTTANGGFCGLDNLGNTCFMNSVIQVLVNTTSFRNYFLESRFQKDINSSNPLGSGGKLAVAFGVVTKVLWEGKRSSFPPSHLKTLVAMKASQFTGFAQHDAQEFLAFLLDGLHEDLNRIRMKQYVEQACLDHLPDKEAAATVWMQYKMRNDSFIVDEFQGQYRSKLVCPVCSKVSITFDPYMYVSVPLPKKKIRLPLFFFRKDPAVPPTKYVLNVPRDCTASEVKKEVSELTGVDVNNLRVVEVYNRKFHKIYENSSLVGTTDGDTIFVFEVVSTALAGEDVLEIYTIQRTQVPVSHPSRCSYCHKEQVTMEKNLRRCTKCYKARYCDQDCQKKHWPQHKPNCKLTHELVGQPFIISLPRSRATYRRIANAMEAYARYSVNTFKPPFVAPTIHDESLARKAGADSISSSELSSDLAEEKSSFSFYIKPVNRSGLALTDLTAGVRLQDQGNTALELPSPYFVAMDWKNNEKLESFVLVQSREMEFKDDSRSENYHEESELSLHKCLRLFTEPEVLTPEEAWYCPNCKEHRQAEKQMSLWTLPNHLIIQLKRFSFRNCVWRDKIDKLVTFPIRGLDLSDYHHGPQESVPPLYDLYGVVNHHGVLLGGHYTAYARCLSASDSTKVELDWRLMNDSHVSLVHNERNVVTKAAYLLFYKRRSVVNPVASVNSYETSVPEQSPAAEVPSSPFDGRSTSPHLLSYNHVNRHTHMALQDDEASSLHESSPTDYGREDGCDQDDEADSNRAEPASPMFDLGGESSDEYPDAFASGDNESTLALHKSYTDMDDVD